MLRISLQRSAQHDSGINEITSRPLPGRFPSGGETPQRIWPTFFRSLPSADAGRGEFCPSRASPDNRARIACRNSAGSFRRCTGPLAKSATNPVSDIRRSKESFIDSVETKFRFCPDDSALVRVAAAARINFQAQHLHALSQVFAENLRAS